MTDGSALNTGSDVFEEALLDRIIPTTIKANEERDPTSTPSSLVKHEERRSWNIPLLPSVIGGRGTLLVFALLDGTK
jgi:hypothetical protein